MLKDKQPVIQDFFSFLKSDLLEVLECLSKGEPWQDHMMGYELPEHSEEIEFKEGVMIFITTSTYNEIIMKNIDFYECLKETCMEFIDESPERKNQVYLLIDKIKVVLNLK
ncbi:MULTISPECIES: hypothetical protein [Bacillaceae]|uniref:hypothetical protein n=1 Tax=Metabacillus sp. 22489 TaxID=3453928 RepID=UPI000BA6B0E8|nr:hypothetical protein CHH83_18885 [Bacillus sp. 7586-K]